MFESLTTETSQTERRKASTRSTIGRRSNNPKTNRQCTVTENQLDAYVHVCMRLRTCDSTRRGRVRHVVWPPRIAPVNSAKSGHNPAARIFHSLKYPFTDLLSLLYFMQEI